jgi:phospholipid transport system substrate-binding protein
MIKNRILIAFLAMLLSINSLYADVTEDVKSTFSKKIDSAIEVAKNKKVDKKIRNNKIVDIMAPMFDFELMAKLTLGKKVWKKLSKAKRAEFTKLYVKRMENSYSSKVDAYTDEQVVIRKIQRNKKNRITLITDVVDQDNKISMIYKYYKPKRNKKGKEEWLVYDVNILGVSIIKTDKSQFKEILKNNTIDDLMTKMTVVEPK